MRHYSVNVVWSDEDNCYIAKIPEFEGLSAHGETMDEAIKEIYIALDGFIEVMKEDGEEIPAPQTYNSFSGQTRVRLSKSLHRDLTIQAKNENVSLNTYINQLLSERNAFKKILNEIKATQPSQEENFNAIRLSQELVHSTDGRYTKTEMGFQEWLGIAH